MEPHIAVLHDVVGDGTLDSDGSALVDAARDDRTWDLRVMMGLPMLNFLKIVESALAWTAAKVPRTHA